MTERVIGAGGTARGGRLPVFGTVWLGQFISVVGSRFTGFALGVWMYQRTGSATQLALIAFLTVLPMVVLAPVAGMLVDRLDRRRLMIVSDIGACLGTIAVWWWFTNGQLESGLVYLFITWGAIWSTFRTTAYFAATTLLVPKEQLGRANGLIQFGPAVARIIGPMIAGVLVMGVGIRTILEIDIVTFGFSLSMLALVRFPRPEATHTPQADEGDTMLRRAGYGWQYIRARPGLFGLTVFFAAINFVESMVIVLIDPLVLSFSTPSTLGGVVSIAGCGMLFGALVMGAWGGPRRRMYGVLGFTVLRGALLFLGGLQANAPLVAVASFVFLFCGQVSQASSQALWQAKVAPDIQGRVFAMGQMLGAVTIPVAFLIAGPLADNVFNPLLAVDGAWANSVGQIIGTGPGRGIGFIYIVLGFLSILITVIAFLYPRIRRLEDELPDATPSDAAQAARPEQRKSGARPVRRWLVRGAVAFLAIAIVLSGGAVWLVRRSWPQVDGTIAVPGLSAPVKVIRDDLGVPNIYAQNEHDLFFAQGYVHAQDRLWQMEVSRRIGSGALSAIVGEPTIQLDHLMRTYGLRRMAERAWAFTTGDARAILEAYAEGVNAYIDSHRDRLPLEFTVLNDSPAPWTPVDSLTWGNMLALNLDGNLHNELLRARVIAQVGEEAAQQLFPPLQTGQPIGVPAEADGYRGLRDARFEGLAVADRWLGASQGGRGSNNWVVSGSRTASGQPLLANDTHLTLQMPSVWYENGLHGGRFDTAGFTLPGVPMIIIGHNQNIAWGVTNLNADVQDVYLEKLDDPQNPKQYEFEGEWHPLQLIQEIIEVRGEEPISLTVYLTGHGPILNDAIMGLILNDMFVGLDDASVSPPMSLRWTLYDGNSILDAIQQINLAANWDEFRTALRDWDAPGQNFLYADRQGNIGYQAAGRVPIRQMGQMGLLPVPGWTGSYEWQGFIPFEQLPHAFNPPAGFLATANNKVTSDDYPYPLTYDWVPAYRVQRISDLLSAKDHLTLEDMKAIQAQTYSPPADILRSYLTSIAPADDLETQALDQVRAWDAYYEADRVGASVYTTWYIFMVRNTVDDELSASQPDTALTDEYLLQGNMHVPAMIELMTDPNNRWFDDVNTPQVETRDDIARRSLVDAIAWLSLHYGRNPQQWQWGQVHTVTFTHTPLGQTGIPPLDAVFNSPSIPARGDQFSVDMTAFRWSEPFAVGFGTAQRMIIDLSDWDLSLAIHTTGQNEQVFHPHRQDMISMWEDVRYHALPFSSDAVEADAKDTLTLTP